eukprot:TRINITY_DN2357_c2_g1_i1.p1 TRINITY_DN2357_c2_g1~~TRINITY_DN2357_c2_g1_i1.p1  ORF type:complete len:113 (+),score=4.96 TRINITY_DN2357_c2_g1_i1:1360-1698(+)
MDKFFLGVYLGLIYNYSYYSDYSSEHMHFILYFIMSLLFFLGGSAQHLAPSKMEVQLLIKTLSFKITTTTTIIINNHDNNNNVPLIEVALQNQSITQHFNSSFPLSHPADPI